MSEYSYLPDEEEDLPADGSVTVATDGVTIHGDDSPAEAACALAAQFDDQWLVDVIFELKRQRALVKAAATRHRLQVPGTNATVHGLLGRKWFVE